MNYDVWNILHDGRIKAAAGHVPGDVTFKIEIAYLCGKLPTSSTHLHVRLCHCTRLCFKPWDGDPCTDVAEFGSRNVWILQADQEGDHIRIDFNEGHLEIVYDSAEIYLAEGTPISQPDLEDATRRYWTEWSEKNARK